MTVRRRASSAEARQPSLELTVATDPSLHDPGAAARAPVLSVSELTGRLRQVVTGDPVLRDVWVTGEITNLVVAHSGHAYFSLKDERATIRAVMWANGWRRLAPPPANGDKVEVHGAIGVYEPRGEVNLVVDQIRRAGLGKLWEAFLQLQEQLGAEGCFDPARKRPLPFLPRGVGVVTSPKGAVIQDIYRVIRRRFPNLPIHLAPARVQGEGAAAELIAGLQLLADDPAVDVIILARGGGSLEDLWCFNEESVARAILACPKPVVSGVGHETDTTIADLVADRRAATPSVAAELVAPVKADLDAARRQRERLLLQRTRQLIAWLREGLERRRACRFLADPRLLVQERRLRQAQRSRELELSLGRILEHHRHRHHLLQTRLAGLDPRRLLARGFLMATDDGQRVITSIRQLVAGMSLGLQFGDGQARVRVEHIEPRREERPS